MKKESQWFLRELPQLVTDKVIDAQTARRLEEHYSGVAHGSGVGRGLVATSIIGGLLIGLGVVMVLGHNWTELPFVARLALAFLPLAICQALAATGQVRGWHGLGWREGIGVLWALAVAASVALVGQLYHLPGDVEGFVMVWALSILPVMYLLRSAMVMTVYLVLLVVWASFSQFYGGTALCFWPLAALVIPLLREGVRGNLYGTRTSVMLWISLAALMVGLGVTLERALPGLWVVIYAGALASIYLVGSFWMAEAPTIWQRPLHTLGGVGTVVLAYMLSFEWPWDMVGWEFYRRQSYYNETAALLDYGLALSLPLAALMLMVVAWRRGAKERLVFGVSPLVAAVGYLIIGMDKEIDSALAGSLFTLYLFVMGVMTLVRGARSDRLGLINGGMFILSALILTRFFDSDLPLLGKGIVFVVLGVMFLGINIFYQRRRRGGAV